MPEPRNESPAAHTEPRCVPLCGAERSEGSRAMEPWAWWKHEALCPMREHLRKQKEQARGI